MCVSPTHTCLFIGMLMPAMRAILRSRTPALLVPRGRADHVDHAAAAHDLAVLADLLDRGTYFHDAFPCAARNSAAWINSLVMTSPARAAAVAEQVRLLEKARIVMRHGVRVQLRHEVHHHHHHDEQRGAAEAKRHALPGDEDLRYQAHRG